jgi:hypothetical protein
MTTNKPHLGDRKVVTKFLFFPKFSSDIIDGVSVETIRWLEKAECIYEFSYYFGWKFIGFAD